MRPRAAAVAAIAALVLPAAAGAAPVALQAAHVHAEDHAWHKGFEKLAEVLRSEPGAPLQLEIHPRGAWGGESDAIHSLRHGLLDLTVLAPSAAAGIARHLAFFDTMYLWQDREHWRRVVDGPVGERIAEMIETGTSQSGSGLRVLAFWGGARRHILARARPYPKLDDMAAVRLGIQDNAMNLEIWRSLGAAPVAAPLRNSIALIGADIVEAVEADLATAAAMNLAETAPHITLTAHGLTLRPLVIGAERWRTLSPEQQASLSKAVEAATRLVRELEPKQEDEAAQRLRAAGATVQELADHEQLRARTESLRRRLAEEVGLSRLSKAIEQEAGRPAR